MAKKYYSQTITTKIKKRIRQASEQASIQTHHSHLSIHRIKIEALKPCSLNKVEQRAKTSNCLIKNHPHSSRFTQLSLLLTALPRVGGKISIPIIYT